MLYDTNKLLTGGGGGGGGGGDFLLACEDFVRMIDHSFPAVPPPPSPFLFYFLKWRLACAYQFHSLRKDQSTVGQRAETAAAECSLTSCV